MIIKSVSAIVILVCLVFITACKPKMPSTYEIHYSEGLKDSVVFVNYNLTADSSCNFYMNYQSFFDVFKNNDFEPIYSYYKKHPELKNNLGQYKGYKPRGFYSNHESDTMEYYSAPHSAETSEEKQYLKPTTGYKPRR